MKNPAAAVSAKRSLVSLIIILVLLSLAEYRIIYRLHGGRHQITGLGHQEELLVEGGSKYKVWTNRLLGPYLIRGCSDISGLPWHSCFLLLAVSSLIGLNCLVFVFSYRLLQHSRMAFVYTAAFMGAFVLLQHYYIYIWDWIDLLVFTLFVYGALRQYSLGFFVLLFFLELLNREAALFIALYIILLAFDFRHFRLRSPRTVLTGSALAIIGIGFIKTSRDLLFKGVLSNQEYYIGMVGEFGNEVHLWSNIEFLATTPYYLITSFGPAFNIVITVFVVAITLFFIHAMIRGDSSERRLAGVALAIEGSILTVGLVMETRMWLVLLPFILFIHLHQKRDKSLLFSETTVTADGDVTAAESHESEKIKPAKQLLAMDSNSKAEHNSPVRMQKQRHSL